MFITNKKLEGFKLSGTKMDRRVIKTKKAIRDTLTELIEEKGFDGITVRDLTERADINRGTFYLHYHDKYDLLEQSEEEVLRALEEVRKNAKDLNLKDIHRYFFDHKPLPFMIKLFEYIQENSQFMKVILGPKGDPSFQVQIKEVIEKGFIEKISSILKKEEVLAPVDIFVAYISSAILGVIQQWLNNGMKQSPHEISSMLLNITVQGPLVTIGLGSEGSK